ncbi:MAG: hypothetical protein ACXWXJ_10315 [Aeromicrobium sp.]
MMATAGIIVGGSGGLGLGSVLGVDIALEPGIAGLSHLPVMILGAAIAASTFAFSAYAPLRALLPIAAISGVAAAIYFVMTEQGFGRAWASAVRTSTRGSFACSCCQEEHKEIATRGITDIGSFGAKQRAFVQESLNEVAIVAGGRRIP